MNKNIFAPALIAAGLMMISPLSANAVSYQVSGMMCDSSFGDDTNARRSGLENNMSSKSIWVSCPVIKFGSSEDSRVQVNLLNNSNRDASVKCILSEHYQGRPVSESEGTVRVRRNGFSDDMFWEGGFDEKTHANVICKLPPGTAIESLAFSSGGGDSSGAPSPSGKVRACITSTTSSFNSASTTVTMKNGMQLNNYDGRYWYSSDSHFTFETTSGAWYSIVDESELVRLDVTREPDSCFEPESDQIESPIRVEAVGTNKRVYLDGGYLVVDDTCPVTKDSVLSYYNPSYNTSAIVDLNTGNDCNVRDVVEN